MSNIVLIVVILVVTAGLVYRVFRQRAQRPRTVIDEESREAGQAHLTSTLEEGFSDDNDSE